MNESTIRLQFIISHYKSKTSQYPIFALVIATEHILKTKSIHSTFRFFTYFIIVLYLKEKI